MQLVEPAAVGAGRLLGRLERTRPLYVVAPLCVVSGLVALGFALSAKHNGWLYYSGGDGTYYWTTPWALAHHILPETVISFGLPVFTMPLAWIFGSSLLAALPVIVLVQVLVLGPIAVIAIYAIGRRLGGPLFAAGATLVWALSPLIAYSFFYPMRRGQFNSVVLPSVLGLNNLADYTSLVLTVAIAALVLRALDERRWNDVAIAGLLCGFLIAVKPANGFFVPAPLAAFLVARAWRQALGFAAAMIPALVTLALWKQAGLGTVPLFGATAVHAAAGTGGLVGSTVTHDYLDFHWSTFTSNLDEIREFGWSLRLAEWAPLAGIVGVARRGLPHAALLGFWCLDYLVLKGGTPSASVYGWSYFRLTLPGFPAYVLLACGIVFLVPGLARRWAPTTARAVPLRFSRGLVAVAAVFALYPLAVVLAHGGAAGNRVAITPANNTVPVTDDLHLHVVQTVLGPSLRWRQPDTGSSHVRYMVFKGPDTGCPPAGAVQECHLTMPVFRTVHSFNFPAWQFGPGYYRVGLVAGPHIARNDGDLLLLSPPIRVR